MGNRKEKIKKSLGLSEYPWSSDDDDSVDGIIFRVPNGSDSHGDYSSAEPIQHNSRNWSTPNRPTRFERDQFWSMLTNTSRMPPIGPQPLAMDLHSERYHDRCQRPFQSVDMKRILSIRKLTRGMNSCRPEMRVPTPMDLTANIGRIKRTDPTRVLLPVFGRTNTPTLHDSSSSAEEPRPSTSRSRDFTLPDLPNTQVTLSVNLDQSDTELDRPQNLLPPPALRDIPDEEIGVIANVDMSRGSASQEDDIVIVEPKVENDVAATAADDGASTGGKKADVFDAHLHTSGATIPNPKPRTLKRKIDSQESSNSPPCTVKEFNQKLLRLMECPVCLEWMEPPMAQCRRGHLVCGRCRLRLSACPVCRTAFSSVRNRAMEGVAEMLRYPCRHGCGLEVRQRRRVSHESSCNARRYRCPAPPCGERAPFALAELQAHMQSKHPALVKIGTKHKFSMNMNSEQHDTWLVLSAPELFYLRVDVDIRSWGVVIYVAYIGPKCNASKFTYEVTVLGQYNERKLVYSRVTHSDLESCSLNVSRQDCFHLTLDQALNFLRQRNKHCESDKILDFHVEINSRDTDVVTKEESEI